MKEEFEKMAAAGKLDRQHIESLVQLTNSGFCMHRSWGFGRIKTVDTVFARFTIDFQNKAGHAMDLAFAAESLRPIPKDHILARKASDLENLRQMAATNHLELVKLVLNSYGGKATMDQIQQVLVPDVIRDDWKKWWEAAKRELKKDGHFQVPLKKSEPIVYQVQEVSLQDRLMADFRAAKGLKARILVAGEFLKNASDLADKQAAGTEIITALNVEIPSYQRTQPPVALEAIFARDDVREMAGLPPTEGEANAQTIWSQDLKLGPLMEQLPASKHRRALESFKMANPERWPEVLRNTINTVSAKLCKEFAGLLIHEGKFQELKETLAKFISQHTASSELLLWLAKDRNDSFADILGPEVFRAMLTAMERDQFNEKRSNRLRDFILDDDKLLVELIGSADLEVIKDLTRALQLSPCFDDMDKRSLLARIVKSYPAIQSLISGEQTKQESSLVVSWESLERRKNEYHELVEKKIPANSKEIAIARSYGDLRENHEYKAAKEMQKLLMRRKAELEGQLVRARGTDFSNARLDAVSMGTVVTATDLETQKSEHFSILGAWDSDPDKGIVSYLSPMAQSLINRKVGEEVEFEVNGVRHRRRIDGIAPYKAPAAPQAEPPSPVPEQETGAAQPVPPEPAASQN
ncbi:MAG TPA: GreA/GreB family elongation factor [Candidatus Dormibacteraeota bacterium]|nr:GreA/GreB family elongation factor [Candidatus Dormibacteraeota bacterium]